VKNLENSATINPIAADLLALGVRPGGVLLAHSSLKALGHVPGGPETVIRGLLAALGPDGTLLMPALTYDRVTPQTPLFDLYRTPANVGAIPENFRAWPGVRRSVHPTNSVCGLGPLADELLRHHHLDTTPCGPHSPFHLLPHYKGQILLLGCGLKPNTSMHAIEELVEPPYLFAPPLTYKLVINDRMTETPYRPHNFAGWRQRYDRVEDLLNGDGLKVGRVLAAQAHLIEARTLWSAALAALQQNPLYFVEVWGVYE
jgi:aminoglycoside 3-N-acetyltransferase